MNEHVLQGHLAKYMLKMGLKEATLPRWGEPEPHTYFKGTEPFDGVRFSPNLEGISTSNCHFTKDKGITGWFWLI
jgi:hypothetical protein